MKGVLRRRKRVRIQYCKKYLKELLHRSSLWQDSKPTFSDGGALTRTITPQGPVNPPKQPWRQGHPAHEKTLAPAKGKLRLPCFAALFSSHIIFQFIYLSSPIFHHDTYKEVSARCLAQGVDARDQIRAHPAPSVARRPFYPTLP